MTTRCHVAIRGFRSLTTLSVFLTAFQSTVANAGPLFDDTKRAILPSHAATTILKSYVADGNWDTAEWPISSEDLDLLEVALAPALSKEVLPRTSLTVHDFYRQYMPARWKGLRVIVVNGFYASNSDLYPNDRRIDPDEWKHELLTIFGGGCGFWSAIYIVEQNRLMSSQSDSDHAMVVCNARK
jgi:hypothetical protein